jgi:hypothetical protein
MIQYYTRANGVDNDIFIIKPNGKYKPLFNSGKRHSYQYEPFSQFTNIVINDIIMIEPRYVQHYIVYNNPTNGRMFEVTTKYGTEFIVVVENITIILTDISQRFKKITIPIAEYNDDIIRKYSNELIRFHKYMKRCIKEYTPLADIGIKMNEWNCVKS